MTSDTGFISNPYIIKSQIFLKDFKPKKSYHFILYSSRLN